MITVWCTWLINNKINIDKKGHKPILTNNVENNAKNRAKKNHTKNHPTKKSGKKDLPFILEKFTVYYKDAYILSQKCFQK